ncbi:hypothetical protein H9P43_005216 [Blastocladiella emersonii ATCC 22665]|nr:hypothetical protein H9P43_005216 [Blastocladiella emersonii ATCC 22665]
MMPMANSMGSMSAYHATYGVDLAAHAARKRKQREEEAAAAAAAAAARSSSSTSDDKHLSTLTAGGDDEALGQRSPGESPRSLRAPSHLSETDSARGLSGHYSAHFASPPPMPGSPAASTASRPTTTFVSSDDFLSQMLGDLHLSYKDYGVEASPTAAAAEGWSAQQRADELDDIYGFYADSSAAGVDPAKENAMRLARNRAKAVKEIVSTEETYCEMLRTLLDVVVYPLRESAKANPKKPVLPVDDINKLFGNVEEIYTFHLTLLDGLQERHALWSDDQKISDIFLTIVPWLKIYKLYLANYPVALDTLTKIRSAGNAKAYADASKLIKAAQDSPRFKGLDITSYMILPIQRIPRYIMLLEQLVHYTQEDHPDFADLGRCVAEVKKMADHINEELRKFEAQKKVLDIAAALQGRPASATALVSPARRFIAQADLQTPMLMALDRRTVFLFSDLLVVAKRVKDNAFEYKDEFDLWTSYVKKVDDQTRDPNAPRIYAFHIVAGKRQYALAAASSDEREHWIKLINDAMSHLQNGGLRRGTAGPPEPLMLGGARTSYGSGHHSPSMGSPSSANFFPGGPRRGSLPVVNGGNGNANPPPSPSAASLRSNYSGHSAANVPGGAMPIPIPIPIPNGGMRRPSYGGNASTLAGSPHSGYGGSPPPRRGSVASSLMRARSSSMARSFEGAAFVGSYGHGLVPPMPPVPASPAVSTHSVPAHVYSTLPVSTGEHGSPHRGGAPAGAAASPNPLHRSRSVDANLYMYAQQQQMMEQQQQQQQQYQHESGSAYPTPSRSPVYAYPPSLDPSNPAFVGSAGSRGRTPSRDQRSRGNGSDAGSNAARDLLKSHGF